MSSLTRGKLGQWFFPVAVDRLVLPVKRALIEPWRALWVLIAFSFAAAQAHAGEIEPRAYVNTPIGVNFALAGYAYSQGGLSTVGSSPIKDAELQMNTGVFAYARTLEVAGRSAKVKGLFNASCQPSSLMR